MNYLKNNKEFLKGYRTDLLELVRNYEKNSRYAKNIDWDEKVEEIRVKQGGKNIYLHSIYNEEREIKKIVENKPKYAEQICFFGIPNTMQINIFFALLNPYFTSIFVPLDILSITIIFFIISY